MTVLRPYEPRPIDCPHRRRPFLTVRFRSGWSALAALCVVCAFSVALTAVVVG